MLDRLKSRVKINNKLVVNAISETFGTFMLLLIGLSVIAQLHLKRWEMNTWIQINVGWGFAVTFSALLVSRTSGGHLNPAVSFMMFTFGKIDFISLIVYCICQVLGAFLGACLVYVVYYDLINHFDNGIRAISGPNGTASVFTTFPPDFLSVHGAFLDQVIGTGILCLFIVVILDPKHKIPAYLHQLYFGLVLMMIGTGFGANLGYPLNPARDLGPRIFASFVYGMEVFSFPYPGYWLIPVFAPVAGAVLFGWMYHIFVGFHMVDDEEEQPEIRYQAVSTTTETLKSS
uniref:Aquaporin n=1 Tax=Panagrolaimus sp. JU765 TaxID=591449 RepID=A0AC34PYU3_9BILA